MASAALRDFPAAAGTRAGETVVLSWTEWPNERVRDERLPQVQADPRVQPVAGEEAIFDGARVIAGGFNVLLEQ